MQIDNNKREETGAHNRPRWLLLTLIILYFIAGQVYPYFHIFQHNLHLQKESELCRDPFNHEHHFHQCCEQHQKCYIIGDNDWQFATIKVKDLNKTTLDLVGFFPQTHNFKSRLSVRAFINNSTHKKFRVSSKQFNKAPPGLS
jgi:hypothetical protein